MKAPIQVPIFRVRVFPFPHPHPGQCCHTNLAKPTRGASLFSLFCRASARARFSNPPAGRSAEGKESPVPRARRPPPPSPHLLGRRCPQRWGKGREEQHRETHSTAASRSRASAWVPEGETRVQGRACLSGPHPSQPRGARMTLLPAAPCRTIHLPTSSLPRPLFKTC